MQEQAAGARCGAQAAGGMRRRAFLGRVSAAVFGIPAFLPRHVAAAGGGVMPSDQVVLGFIGTGRRAQWLIRTMPPEGRIVAICDCHRARVEETLKNHGDPKWKTYQDYRAMLDAEELEGVVVPTPDHQRVLICMHACQAGVDVYAEKPLSLTLAEGRALVNAVRRYGRVLQVGSQQRSLPLNRYLCRLVRDGGIGAVRAVSVCNYVSGAPGDPRLPEEPIPEGLDWDLWSSQAPLHPYHTRLFESWWSWRCYHGGDITNMGPHGLDMMQYALGMDATGPVEVRLVSEGHEGPPTTCPLVMRFAGGVEMRFELDRQKWGHLDGGGIFWGEKCELHIARDYYRASPPDAVKDVPPPFFTGALGYENCTAPHLRNWIECIKTRRRPHADVEIGHRAASLCHLGNVARDVGRTIRWDPDREVCVGDAQAQALCSRERRAGYELPDLG